jgi:hypothetical protein
MTCQGWPSRSKKLREYMKPTARKKSGSRKRNLQPTLSQHLSLYCSVTWNVGDTPSGAGTFHNGSFRFRQRHTTSGSFTTVFSTCSTRVTFPSGASVIAAVTEPTRGLEQPPCL